jgi:hypothetical protein
MDTGFPRTKLISFSFANANLTNVILFHFTFPGIAIAPKA